MNNKQSKTNQNIDEQIILLKKELIHYHIKKSTKQEVKPHLIKKTKYKIANLLTQKSYSLPK